VRIKTYVKYWLPIPAFLILGYLTNGTVDIAIHDTFVAIERLHIALLVGLFLFISGLGYLILESRMKTGLTKAHGWFTVIGVLITLGLGVALNYIYSTPPAEQYEYAHIEQNITLMMGQLGGIGLVLVGFILYLVNIAVTSVNQIKKSPK